jgi:hypothetical protein
LMAWWLMRSCSMQKGKRQTGFTRSWKHAHSEESTCKRRKIDWVCLWWEKLMKKRNKLMLVETAKLDKANPLKKSRISLIGPLPMKS